MKKTLFIFFVTIISLFSSIAFAATETCDKSYGAVVYMPFDADASDASGNGNDGTVSGATWSATSGYDGTGAYIFDATNEDYISVPSISGWDSGNSGATFTGRVYSTTSGTNRHVLDSESGGFLIDSFSTGRWVGQAQSAGSGNYYTPGVLGVGVQATLNTWEHMAVVLDPTTSEIRAYINGVEYISSGEKNLDEDIISLFIGRNGVYSGANANYFTGVIDEVRVFDSALSATDIELMYTGQFQCDDGYTCSDDGNCEAADTDEDGIIDIDEATYGTDPEDSDSDNDGISDYDEIMTYSTDPTDSDSDEDGIDDGDEVAAGTDPNDYDSDDDGLSDYAEKTYKTDPSDSDSDDDGIDDSDEAAAGSDPNKADSDGDGISDYDEIMTYKTNPTDSDSDDDGLLDKNELTYGTNPNTSDSDGDGVSDGAEVLAGTSPTDSTDYVKKCNDSLDNDKDGYYDYMGACNVGGTIKTCSQLGIIKSLLTASYCKFYCTSKISGGLGGTYKTADPDCINFDDNVEATLTLKKTSIIGKAIATSETEGDLSWLMVVVGILGIIGVTAVIIKNEKNNKMKK